jgi:hypothetical protein
VSAALATWGMLASRDGDDSWAAGFGADLLGGILAGLIGSAIVLAAGWWWRRRRNRADFGCLAGTYNVTEKQPSQKPEGTVTINGDGPLLAFVWTTADGSNAEGMLTMNEQARTTGTGSYARRSRVRGASGPAVIVAVRRTDEVSD